MLHAKDVKCNHMNYIYLHTGCWYIINTIHSTIVVGSTIPFTQLLTVRDLTSPMYQGWFFLLILHGCIFCLQMLCHVMHTCAHLCMSIVICQRSYFVINLWCNYYRQKWIYRYLKSIPWSICNAHVCQIHAHCLVNYCLNVHYYVLFVTVCCWGRAKRIEI